MIKEHFDLLRRAVDKGHAENIDVHYNTNTTQYQKIPTIWKHFKHVQIAFSVDNTEERFEYERFGANWKTSNRNIKKVHKLREQGYPHNYTIMLYMEHTKHNVLGRNTYLGKGYEL